MSTAVTAPQTPMRMIQSKPRSERGMPRLFATLVVLCGFHINDAQGQTAKFLGADRVTQGNWKTVYGKEGHSIFSDTTENPSYGSGTSSGNTFVWSAETSDVRALQKNSGTGRVAAAWYGSPFDLDFAITDNGPHRISIYFVDWDNFSRSQVVEVRMGRAMHCWIHAQFPPFNLVPIFAGTFLGTLRFDLPEVTQTPC